MPNSMPFRGVRNLSQQRLTFAVTIPAREAEMKLPNLSVPPKEELSPVLEEGDKEEQSQAIGVLKRTEDQLQDTMTVLDSFLKNKDGNVSMRIRKMVMQQS